jgi:hypothetical protein
MTQPVTPPDPQAGAPLPSPWVGGTPGHPGRGAEIRPPRLRWANRAIVALLAISGGLIAVSLAPAVGRNLGLTHTRAVAREPISTSRTIGESGHEGISLAERLLELDRLSEDAPLGRGPLSLQPAQSLRDLGVHQFPSDATPPIGVVHEGEEVHILREVEGWAMVHHKSADGSVFGWVPRSALRVR